MKYHTLVDIINNDEIFNEARDIHLTSVGRCEKLGTLHLSKFQGR